MDDRPCEITITIQLKEVEEFIRSLPNYQRGSVVKEIIRKHLRAQSDIKVKSTNPFAKDFQMTPSRDTSGLIQSEYVLFPAKQSAIKPEKAVEPQLKEEPAIIQQPEVMKETTSTPQPEVREETDEEREMRMALIAMAGE